MLEQVFLESEEFGREYFGPVDPDNLGIVSQFLRVLAAARKQTTLDKVERRVGIEVPSPVVKKATGMVVDDIPEAH